MFESASFALLVVIVTVIYYYYHSLHRNRQQKKNYDFDRIPGPSSYPLIGNMWKLTLISRGERMKYMRFLEEKYGTLFQLWVGRKPLIICADAEDAQIILNSRSNINRALSNFMKFWLGNTLLTINGAEWYKRRKMLSPAFHVSVLESFCPIIVNHCRTFVEKLKPLEHEKHKWDIHSFVNRFTLDVICETIMRVNLDIQNNESCEYLEKVSEMKDIIVEKMMRPWWHNEYLYSFSNLHRREMRNLQAMRTLTKDIIQKKQRQRHHEEKSTDPKEKKGFLNLLLDMVENSRFEHSVKDIQAEVDAFIAAGHDTLTSGILSIIHFLSTNPEIQDEVAEELFSIFGNSVRDPTMEDISKMKYLECVIKESHRLLPPAPSTSRQLSEAITLRGKYVIPAGTMIHVNIFSIHRQEKYFSNPMKFDPNNFSPENVRLRHSFAYIPFGAGLRNCIGQKFAMLEEKVLISSLLRNYEIQSSQKLEDLRLVSEIVLRHLDGVLINITPRVWVKYNKLKL